MSMCPRLHHGKGPYTRPAEKSVSFLEVNLISADTDSVFPWQTKLPIWGTLDGGAEAHCCAEAPAAELQTGSVSMQNIQKLKRTTHRHTVSSAAPAGFWHLGSASPHGVFHLGGSQAPWADWTPPAKSRNEK